MRRTLPPSTIALLLLLLVVVAFAARSARADEDDARPKAALAACVSGDEAKGISILGQLYAETRNPAYLFNLGRCYQQNGHLAQARTRFVEYLRVGKDEPPEDLHRAEGFVKEIDDALARQRAAEPATPLVTPAPSQPVAPRAEEGHAQALRVTAVVLAAIGVAAVGAGVFLSLKVQSTNDTINAEFAGQQYVTDGAKLQRQMADGARYETWQWVSYGLGIAALAGAATTFVLGGLATPWGGSSEHAAVALVPALAPGSVGGTFQLRF